MWSALLIHVTDQWVMQSLHIKHEKYEDKGQARHYGGYHRADCSVEIPWKWWRFWWNVKTDQELLRQNGGQNVTGRSRAPEWILRTESREWLRRSEASGDAPPHWETDCTMRKWQDTKLQKEKKNQTIETFIGLWRAYYKSIIRFKIK